MNNASKEVVGRRVRALRDRLGWSQLRLANHLGVSIGMVSHYETGRNLIPVDVGTKLAKVSKVTLDWLYGGEGRGR